MNNESVLAELNEIKRLIVEKNPNDDDKFLRSIWELAQEAEEEIHSALLAKDTQIAEAEKRGRNMAVDYINIRAVRGSGYAEATCVYEDSLQKVLASARQENL